MVRCYEIEKSQTNWKTIWFFQIQVAIYYLSYLLQQNRNTFRPASPYICKNIILLFTGYMKTIFRSRLIWKFAW